VAEENPLPLVEATYWLESAVLFEKIKDFGGEGTLPASLLKNTGFAHLQLIRCKALGEFTRARKTGLPLPRTDLFRSVELIDWPVFAPVSGEDKFEVESNGEHKSFNLWRNWSTQRFVHFWGSFLEHPDSHLDPQYDTIRGIYQSATGGKRAGPESAQQGSVKGSESTESAAGDGGSQEAKRKKRKAKKKKSSDISSSSSSSSSGSQTEEL
jgi:hypothetical protein